MSSVTIGNSHPNAIWDCPDAIADLQRLPVVEAKKSSIFPWRGAVLKLKVEHDPSLSKYESLVESIVLENKEAVREARPSDAAWAILDRLSEKVEPTPRLKKVYRSIKAALFSWLKIQLLMTTFLTCICLAVAAVIMHQVRDYAEIRGQSEEAFLSSCVSQFKNATIDPTRSTFERFSEFHEPVSEASNLSSIVSSTCLGILSFKDLFVQRLGEILTGAHSFEKIGTGITDSSFLLDEAGNRVAVLKKMTTFYSDENWECLVREILGNERQHLVAGIAKITLNNIDYMAVEYLKSIPLISLLPSPLQALSSSAEVSRYLEIPSFIEGLQTIWLLDLIFSNADRNAGNLLLTCDGFKAIDHDFLLSRETGAMLLDASKHTLESLNFFKHKNLLTGARNFLDSLTPEFIKKLATKYQDQLQRHFRQKALFKLSYNVDHVGRFINDTLISVSWIKRFVEGNEGPAAIDAFVKTRFGDEGRNYQLVQ